MHAHGAPVIADENAPTAELARQSLISGLALLLRDQLKQLYSLTFVYSSHDPVWCRGR